VLALGHTATDQAETVLLNLARGADLRGMGGMRELDPRTDPPLVRPLLGLVREETREVARLLRVPFVDDPGNEDVRSPRVRVRRQILPALGSGGPAVVRAIGAAALAAQAAEEALASHDAGGALDAPQGDAPRADTLPPDALPNGPRALRLRHLRERCGAQGVDLAELRRSVLGEVEQALARGTHGQWDVHPRRRIRVRAGRFWVEPPNH
jgi:tRNA(Ile)-lysidine synthase TilS/MesJ